MRMDNLIKKSKILFDSFWCKLFFVILPFFSELPLLMPYMVPLMKIGLVWAALCIVYDLFTERIILKTKYMGLIVLFIIGMFFSVILNYDNSMSKMNIIEFFYTCAVLIVLFPAKSLKNENAIKEITIINYTLAILTFIVAVISLVTFVMQYKFSITFNDYTYNMGCYQRRLVGLYKNAIYPTAALGIWCSVSQLIINTKRNIKKSSSIISTIFFTVCIIVGWIFVVLQNSKGIFIGCLGALLVLAFFAVQSLDTKRYFKDKKILKYISAVALIAVCACICITSIYAIRNIASWGVIKIARSTNHLESIENIVIENDKEELNFDRDVSSEYGFATGRIYIWQNGLKLFLEKPIFGYGPYSLSDKIEVYSDSAEKVSHFHNVFIHTLVSVGAFGFIIFVLLFFLIALQVLRYLFKKNNKHFIEALSPLGIIIFLFIINLADTTILFQTKHSGFIFFIYLGYLVATTNDDKTLFCDKPIRTVDGIIEKTISKIIGCKKHEK